MKHILMIVCILYGTIPATAQSSVGQKHLAQLPPLLANTCGCMQAEEDQYSDQIHRVLAAIEQERDRIEYGNPTPDELISGISKKTGIAQSELKRLGDQGTEADGEKLAEQQMQKQYGISQHEIDQMENMSEAELQQWGKQYAANRNSSGNTKQGKAVKIAAISTQIADLESQFNQHVEKWKTMASDYALLERNAKKKLQETVERVEKSAPKEIYQGEHCINQKAIDEYFEHNLPPVYKAYCEETTPKYKQYLNTRKTDLPKIFNLLDNLAVLKCRMLKEQTGIEQNIADLQAIQSMSLVEDHAKAMLDLGNTSWRNETRSGKN